MHIQAADKARAKGWLCGPWDSDLDISLGYANQSGRRPIIVQPVGGMWYTVARRKVGNSAYRRNSTQTNLARREPIGHSVRLVCGNHK